LKAEGYESSEAEAEGLENLVGSRESGQLSGDGYRGVEGPQGSRSHEGSSEANTPKIPPILHHIALGSRPPKQKWLDARSACVEVHQGWEAKLWTDENAAQFVEERFPGLKKMWESYEYPIQRIDALRYMVLHEFGGMFASLPLLTSYP
jgi:mannosyltransferase OCH1-like enzyme